MTNFVNFTVNGFEIPESSTTIKEFLIEKFKAIYNLPADTDFSSNTPDGQIIELFSTICYEYWNILGRNIYSSQFWSTAVGSQLDLHAFFKNITRRQGTFTLQDIEIIADRNVTLQGLDGDFENLNATAYTVQNDTGQQFLLVNTATLVAGTYTLQFRAKERGQIITTPNTLTDPVDIILGVVSVNNPTAQTSMGSSTETDAEFRARGNISNNSTEQNSVLGMEAGLINLPNVVDVRVLENDSNTIDANNIPPNGTWVIIEGGDDNAIAEKIFEKKGWGSQKGTVSINITKPDGSSKTILFDRQINQNLFVKFDIKRTRANQNWNLANIANYIANNIQYRIGFPSESSALVEAAINAISENGGGGVPLVLEISKDNLNWSEYIETETVQHKFILSSLNINITLLS